MTRRSDGRMGVALLTLSVGLMACGRAGTPAPSSERAPSAPAAALAGSQACASCHPDAYAQWQRSDHHEAMQVANASTVKGDFGSARFTYNGVTSTFSTRNGRFMVRTDGPDGTLADFPVAYTFGWRPLQQYLLAPEPR